MAIVSFQVLGEPMGKQRTKHRYFKGKDGKINSQEYTPGKTKSYESDVKEAYRKQTKGHRFPDDTALYVLIDCFMQHPKASNKKVREMLSHILRPCKTPDWDNVGKIICDALNKTAYKDDSRIVDGRVRKYWSQVPRVVVTLSDTPINFSNYYVKEETNV